MHLNGFLDGQQIRILYDFDGLSYIDIFVRIGEVTFDWDQLSPLQQEQILSQLKRSGKIDYDNYN